MKKKIIIILFIILAAIFFGIYNNIIKTKTESNQKQYNNKTEIITESENICLNNEYRYRVWAEIKDNTFYDVAPSVITSQYYEIDIEKNKVYYKEDCLPTEEFEANKNDNGFYSGRILEEKNLTQDESNKLKELLDKTLYNDSTKEDNEKEDEWELLICYRVSNKDKENIGMYNKDDQNLFMELVK